MVATQVAVQSVAKNKTESKTLKCLIAVCFWRSRGCDAKFMAWPAKINRTCTSLNDSMGFEAGQSYISFSICFKLLFHHHLSTFCVNFLLFSRF